jgi:hypothetical protein
MADTWRLAISLQVLRSEILSKYPGTTIWTIGDQSHASGASDHNPNAQRVVCAIDVKADGGLDLAWFAEFLKNCGHPQIKYVIYNGRIWSKARDSEGWRKYNGSNDHSEHVHASSGVGSDGKSAPGTYDSPVAWGLKSGSGYIPPTSGRDNMFPSYGEKSPAVQYRQRQLSYLGYPLERDSDYGAKTAAALKKFVEDFSTSSYDGKEVTSWVGLELDFQYNLARGKNSGLVGPRGPEGPAGPPGKDGKNGADGKLTGSFEITGGTLTAK